jgi:hypothetical protein
LEGVADGWPQAALAPMAIAVWRNERLVIFIIGNVSKDGLCQPGCLEAI